MEKDSNLVDIMNFDKMDIMNFTEYKKYHESYMQNNHGSTAIHTFLCIFFTLQSALLCTIIPRSNGVTQIILEYFIIVLPLVLVHTLMSNYIYILNLVVFIVLVNEIRRKNNLRQIKRVVLTDNVFKDDRIKSITCLRGLTYLITGFCILAVDFKQFPRYLAKTEKYGYSLMDTGVGLFIMISGLVHKDINKKNYVPVLKGHAKFIFILLFLGIARYVSIKQLDYQEHVTEYGVHWNFFFTLAVCKLISSLLLSLSSHTLFLSVLTMCIHEVFLYIGLQNWVFGGTNRIGFLNANREGISSSLGYVALYLCAANLKKELNKKAVNRGHILKKLVFSALILVLISFSINTHRPTSRTLANAGYITYLCALTVLGFCVMYPLEILLQDNKTNFIIPVILSYINDNGLLYFLISNLSTGIINMLFKTLLLPSIVTIIILNIYMILTISLTIHITNRGVKL